MSQVQFIEICFENCESVKIDQEQLIYLDLSNITSDINRYNKTQKCDSCEIAINKAANIEYSPFGLTDYLIQKVFDRILAYDDIVSIQIHYDDDTEDYIYVPYKDKQEGELGTPNINQHTYLDDGNLYIQIKQ